MLVADVLNTQQNESMEAMPVWLRQPNIYLI
jgi:hypothetical protein